MTESSSLKLSSTAPDEWLHQFATRDWWRGAVIYEIYVRSFADSNGRVVPFPTKALSRASVLRWKHRRSAVKRTVD
jgi:hypothetical protein